MAQHNDIAGRLAQLEQVQNKLVGMVSSDVRQLAGAVAAMQHEHSALGQRLAALEQTLRALLAQARQAPAPRANGASYTPVAEVVNGVATPAPVTVTAKSSSGVPLADMNEEDAQIMLTGGED
jgi:phage shock protein A